MSIDGRIAKEIKKKNERRIEESSGNSFLGASLFEPVAPKKPIEFGFDKNDVNSFEFPIAIGNTIYEIKRDGFGIDVIIDDEIRLFSLNGNRWNLDCFPELHNGLKQLPRGYYRGEVFGLSPNEFCRFTALQEFMAIQKRPKMNVEDNLHEIVERYPLRLEFFDILRHEDSSMLLKPFWKRRKLLEQIVPIEKHIGLVPQLKAESKDDLLSIFTWALEKGYEGLVGKDLESHYIPGSRDTDWIKLKNFTTVDLAVLGFYETDSSLKAGKPFSAVLVGSYNKKTGKFETLAKIKIGKKDDAVKIGELVSKAIHTNCKYDSIFKDHSSIIFNPMIAKENKKIPFKLIDYGADDNIIILEIQILDVTYSENWHSCGLNEDEKKAHSLRIPTFVQIRSDKNKHQDVTSTEEIRSLHFG